MRSKCAIQPVGMGLASSNQVFIRHLFVCKYVNTYDDDDGQANFALAELCWIQDEKVRRP